MAKTTKRRTEPEPPPSLVVPRAEAEEKIKAQIGKGHTIYDAPINSKEELSEARLGRGRWDDYNTELLRRLFDNERFANEYSSGLVGYYGASDLPTEVKEFRTLVGRKISKLESVLGRLDLIPAPDDTATPVAQVASEQVMQGGNDIFVVHGHDEEAKKAVASFIQKIELNPVILHEQPDKGRTIIEKFEQHANVGYAVVLLTPDDVGYPKDAPEGANPRARQNVILELGYFLGKLGRDRVCALHKGDVEIPSDYHGVLFVPMDPHGAWRSRLVTELRAAGIEIDPNKALEGLR